MTDIKLPFGLKDNAVLHISKALQGLACGCICPSCKEPLVARKGAVIVHHFAHYRGAQCAHAVETALHLAAKQILAEYRQITLPAVHVHFGPYRDSVLVAPASTFALDDVQEEHRVSDIVPDVLAVSGPRQLIIEIRVTHAVDEGKLQRIRALGISAIEIDLSSASRTFSPADLTDAIIRQIDNKKWLFNAKAEEIKRGFLQTGERMPTIRRGFALHVDYCPIRARVWKGKPYANVVDDCTDCGFALDVTSSDNHIVCGGSHKIRTVKELRDFQALMGLRRL